MAFDTSDTWQKQYDFLKGLVEGHTGPGDYLDGIVSVEEVAPPEGRDLPAIGIQFSRLRADFEAQGFESQTNQFDVSILVMRDFDPSRTDIVRATKMQAEKLWNNRLGGGLGPLLRSDPTLGNTAQWSLVQDLQIMVGRDVTEKTRTSAVVVCTLVAKGRLELF